MYVSYQHIYFYWHVWLCFFLQVKNVSGEPDVLLNDPNPFVGGSREYLDDLDHNKPLYLPG